MLRICTPLLIIPVFGTPVSLSFRRRSKFWYDFFVARKKFRGIFSVVEPPVIAPSSTRHHFGSPSQPLRVLPSNNSALNTEEAAAAMTKLASVVHCAIERGEFMETDHSPTTLRVKPRE